MFVALVVQVTHVVCGEVDGQGTSKHTAALQRGIPTVDEQFMLKLIKHGKVTAPAGSAAGGARELKDGEEFEFPRQGADPYVIKNIVSPYLN